MRTADAFPVVASLPPKTFLEREKRRPEMRLPFAALEVTKLKKKNKNDKTHKQVRTAVMICADLEKK